MRKKRALITGGAKGLGRAITVEFAKHGYDLIITYLSSEEQAREMKELLEKEYPVEVILAKIDLANTNEIESFTRQIEDLDVIVNNAAYYNDDKILNKTAEDFLETYRINVVAPFLLSKHLYEQLKKNRGSIVNISSTNGIDSMYPESADYDASKAALLNLTKNLSLAFAPHIRVNAIAPGWIETEATFDMEGKFKERELATISLKRFAKPEEIAKVVYFVASDDASYMTGSIIRVDGGDNRGNR